MRRILVLNWQDRENPQAGGAEEHVHQVFGRLARRGYQVTLLASGFEGCEPRVRLDDIEVHRTGGRYTFSIAAPWYYLRNLRGERWDVVVDNLNKVPLFSPWWTSAPVVPVVHHLFGLTAFREASFPLAAATWLMERPLPLVYRRRPTIAVSRSTRDDLTGRGLRAPMEVIPVGVDTVHYTPHPGGRSTPRPSLLYLGRLKRYKGVDLLVRAVAKLAREGLYIDFKVAGAGDGRPELEQLVKEMGVEERVIFLGFVDDRTKIDLMRTSWVHGLTSPKEGWGITVLEAGACGTPSVASDSPGLREAVLAGKTGLLVPHGDVDALAGAIRRLVTDRQLRDQLGAGARRYAESLSWEATSVAVERFLLSASPGDSAV
ncbi:MAG: glycosyltransferase family 4 protein [Gammaproteobacteria bacterium]|nr:glycosyltransferase family 4 protein [Gammaproteobacteria bacterium]